MATMKPVKTAKMAGSICREMIRDSGVGRAQEQDGQNRNSISELATEAAFWQEGLKYFITMALLCQVILKIPNQRNGGRLAGWVFA